MTLSILPSIRLNKMMFLGIFHHHSGYRQHEDFLTTFRKLISRWFWTYSIFNFCLASSSAEKARLESGKITGISIASLQTGFLSLGWYYTELSFMNLFLKILYIVCSPNSNG
jgi:hypothetical protein